MKAMVIGGSGFMGSHTADELSNRGYEVTIFDRIASPWLRNDQKMVVGDYMDAESLADAMKGASILYHFAGWPTSGNRENNPLRPSNPT